MRVPGKGRVAKRIARSSKKPTDRSPNGSVAAAELLDEAQVRAGLRLDSAEVAVLKLCCTDNPPRNAAAIVSAIRTRLEYSQPKPKQEIGVEAVVTYKLLDPFAKREGGE